jgi:hypothetical protein
MKWKATSLFVLTLALSAALTLWLKWRDRLVERDLHARMRQQADILAELTARRVRLSEELTNQTTQLKSATKALARARAEVSQLRKDTIDSESLRAALAKINEEGEKNRLARELIPASGPGQALASWSKEQIAFAGYAEPTSAVQTALWAMSQHDPRVIESALAPEALRQLTLDAGPPDPDPTATSQRALAERRSKLQRLAASVAPASGFSLVSNDIVPRIPGFNRNHHVFKVYFEGEGATRGIQLTKIDEQWKLVGVLALGGTEEKPTYESTLWP